MLFRSQKFIDYNTIPDSLLALYGDYLPENYLCRFLASSLCVAINDVEATADSRIDVAAQQTPSGDGKRRRGRPRKSEAAPSRRNRMLRLCIDPNPPTINKGRCGEWLRRSGGEGQWIPCAALGHLAPRS